MGSTEQTTTDDDRRWSVAYALDDLWEGDIQGVEIGDHKVVLVNADGEVRADKNKCPHQAWPLDDGDFDGEKIVCSNHSWKFDAKPEVGSTDCALIKYPCAVDDVGMIYVDVG